MSQIYLNINSNYPSSFTGKERDSETGFSYFGARYYDSDILTAWLSVDPLADKYPGVSPYAYCAWNPVKLVDPDGEEIMYKENGVTYVYRLGEDRNYYFFKGNTNEKYSGKNSQYVNDLVVALGTLKEKPYGNDLVSFFEGNTENNVSIYVGNDKNEANGRDVYWDNTKETLIPIAQSESDVIQYEKSKPFVSLAHELAHVRDLLILKDDAFNQLCREKQEQNAMFAENNVRYEHNMNQRTYYGLVKINDHSYKTDFSSYKATTVSSNNYLIKK